MRRKKSGLESTAFAPPFYTPTIGANAYKIPEEYESDLLDMYTKLTSEEENNSTPDITIEQLPNILLKEFRIPIEIIPDENELKLSWSIPGTNVVDFEKWLYNGFFWLLLSEHIEDVDMLWQDIWSALNVDKSLENLRKEKMYLKDVKKLIEIGKLDASAVGMLQTAGNGKVFISYVDFFVLLGRLGMFN